MFSRPLAPIAANRAILNCLFGNARGARDHKYSLSGTQLRVPYKYCVIIGSYVTRIPNLHALYELHNHYTKYLRDRQSASNVLRARPPKIWLSWPLLLGLTAQLNVVERHAHFTSEREASVVSLQHSLLSGAHMIKQLTGPCCITSPRPSCNCWFSQAFLPTNRLCFPAHSTHLLLCCPLSTHVSDHA